MHPFIHIILLRKLRSNHKDAGGNRACNPHHGRIEVLDLARSTTACIPPSEASFAEHMSAQACGPGVAAVNPTAKISISPLGCTPFAMESTLLSPCLQQRSLRRDIGPGPFYCSCDAVPKYGFAERDGVIVGRVYMKGCRERYIG